MGLQTALRGLQAAQEAIDTTGHNIANANTPGYSRQRAVMTESHVADDPGLLERRPAPASSSAPASTSPRSTASATSSSTSSIALRTAAENQADDASRRSSTRFRPGWPSPRPTACPSDVGLLEGAGATSPTTPTSPAAKQAVINDGQTLAQTFNTIDQQLATVQSQVGQQYAPLIGPSGQVQSDATQIAAAERVDRLGAGRRPEPQRPDSTSATS